MASLKMLRDRILVLPIERKLSAIIEVKNTEKFNLGTVIACGPGKEINGRVHPMDVKVGDTIRYGEFDFPVYVEDGKRHQIITEADVAAIVVPETAVFHVKSVSRAEFQEMYPFTQPMVES